VTESRLADQTRSAGEGHKRKAVTESFYVLPSFGTKVLPSYHARVNASRSLFNCVRPLLVPRDERIFVGRTFTSFELNEELNLQTRSRSGQGRYRIQLYFFLYLLFFIMSGSSFDFGSLMGGKSGTVDDQPPSSPLASSGSFGAFRGGDGKKYCVIVVDVSKHKVSPRRRSDVLDRSALEPGREDYPPPYDRMCIHTSEFKEREANQCGPAWLASSSRLYYSVYKL